MYHCLLPLLLVVVLIFIDVLMGSGPEIACDEGNLEMVVVEWWACMLVEGAKYVQDKGYGDWVVVSGLGGMVCLEPDARSLVCGGCVGIMCV